MFNEDEVLRKTLRTPTAPLEHVTSSARREENYVTSAGNHIHSRSPLVGNGSDSQKMGTRQKHQERKAVDVKVELPGAKSDKQNVDRIGTQARVLFSS